jgi:hypothetical protein
MFVPAISLLFRAHFSYSRQRASHPCRYDLLVDNEFRAAPVLAQVGELWAVWRLSSPNPQIHHISLRLLRKQVQSLII